MGRARHASAARFRSAGAPGRTRAGGALRAGALGAGAVLWAALGCSQLSPDLDAVVAIEIVVPDSGFFELGDTLFPRARPLDGRGDSVAAEVSWATLDPAVIDVEETTGATVGIDSGGAGRLQARVGTLPSNPVTVVAQAPLDTMYLLGDRVADTVTVTGTPRDTLSDSVRIQVEAPAPRMTSAQALVRRRVTYEFAVFPSAGATITLVPNDTGFTNTTGIAVVQVRLDSGSAPDSVMVTASSMRRDGTPVPGSPITFVVEFRP